MASTKTTKTKTSKTRTKKGTKKMANKTRKTTAKAANVAVTKTVVKVRATEAIEGAVCYLQEQLKKDGINLNDSDAFAAVRIAARTTKTLFAQA